MAAILNIKKMPIDEILHTLWKMFPRTLENWYQSTKKVCTTFPPEVRFLPDYDATHHFVWYTIDPYSAGVDFNLKSKIRKQSTMKITFGENEAAAK